MDLLLRLCTFTYSLPPFLFYTEIVEKKDFFAISQSSCLVHVFNLKTVFFQDRYPAQKKKKMEKHMCSIIPGFSYVLNVFKI